MSIMSFRTKGNESNYEAEESGTVSAGSKTLPILNELNELYKNRIRRIDEEAGEDGTEIKVLVLQSWVSDLEEQNTMLIQAVEQLEQEAADRVSLLQESLQRSSQAAVAYMTKLDDFDKGVSVEKDKDSIIEDLKAELLSLRMKLKNCGYGKRSNGSELKEEVIALKEDNELKEGKIQGYIRRFQELGDSMHDKSCQVVIETQPRGKSSDDKYFEELDVCLNKALQEKSELVKQVEQLKTQLKESVVEIEQLSKAVNDKDQSAKDMRKALTAEVADKHDQNLALRREIQLLEERYRQADMQTHFRDVIIKEMRKDLKVARLKLASIDLDQQNPVVCNGQQCMSSFLPSNHPTCQSQFSSVQPNSEQEQHCLLNVTCRLYSHPHEHQQVQFPVNKSNHDLQGHTSPDKPHDSCLPYQHLCTPEKIIRPVSEKLYNVENTDEAQIPSACRCKPFLENIHLPHPPDMSFQLGDEETYYEVRRRNTQPSRDVKISADRKVVSGPKVDTVPVQNHPKQEMINKDTIEHLKNKLLMRDNTIKKQQENIHDLQNTLKKYQNDLNDLHLKTKETKMELEDFKLQCIEQGHENIPNKSKQDEAVIVTSEVQTQHSLSPEFSGDHGGCIVQYLNKDEDEFRTLNDLIEQINELSDILKARESKITVQDVMISNLQKKVKASHVEVVMIKEKCEKYLQDIQKTEQNQAGCERRIKELNDVLERSYTDLQDSLNSMDIGENTTCILCDQNMKNFHQRYDESQEAFKNLKAEFSYLLFNLKSHEKQVTYLGGMIDSLNEVLQRNQCDLEDILSKTSVFSKEKRAFHVDHEECQQKIERLEKSLKHFQEERQKWYSKLESLAENKTAEVLQEEHESLKAEIEKLQNNLISREKVAANQEQIINILQDSVNIAQKEQQDFQQKLKDAEAEKEMLLNALQEEQRKAVNLQEALLATKQQLEDLQGNKYELIIKDRIIRFLRLDLSEIKSQYSNCYGEVVKQEKVLDTLRDSSDDLKTEIVNLEQDICLLEFHLAEKLKVLCFIKDHVKEMEAELSDRDRIIKDQVNHILELNNKIQDQMNEIQEFKNKIRDKNNILQDQINEIQLLNSNIQGQSIKLIDQRNQLDDESNKIQELNGKLQVQCKKLEDQACKIQELTTEIQDLSRENNDLVIKTKELEVEGIYWRSVKEESEEMLLEQKQLTIKNKMIQSLQDNMNEINHIAVQRLEGKEKLIQNLQSHISRLQIQLKYENQKATPFEEVNTLQKEAERLKSENKQLLLLQDRLKAEVREYMSVPETWWWDDFWQI